MRGRKDQSLVLMFASQCFKFLICSYLFDSCTVPNVGVHNTSGGTKWRLRCFCRVDLFDFSFIP